MKSGLSEPRPDAPESRSTRFATTSAGRFYRDPLARKLGYRTLTDETVKRLRFIKHTQALGFTLNEIKELLALRLTPGKTCADVRSRAEAKIADIERKILSLQVMEQALQQLVSACESDGPASKCSFLENLNKEDMP
jgi:MerR family copper efflux transcriptional regulator